MKTVFVRFWTVQPALLVGLYFLVGGALALCWHWALFLPLFLLLFLSGSPLKGGIIVLAFFIYAKILYPPTDFTEATGTGYFSIHSLKVQPTPFNRSYAYTGILKKFETEEGAKAYNIPCKIYLPLKKERALANADYRIQGTFKEGQFKADKKATWEIIPHTFSCAEGRFQAKEAFRKYLKIHLKDPRVLSFLSTLTTGDIDERSLSFEFGKLGLQHILAISGFHFGLLALFLGFILRLFFTLKLSSALLLILLTGYYFFIGNSPSVQRAWIAVSVFLIGFLLNLRCSPLNALGMGLILELLFDPLSLKHIGFQLSFLATLSLLLLYQPINQFLNKIFPERPLKTLVAMSRLDQHGYLLSAFVRKSLAINLAVHLFTLPTLLFLFSKFPFLSIAYNLFFPFWMGLSFLLLLLSLPFPFLHSINNSYTSLLLDITSHPPAFLNYYFYCPPFSFSLLIVLLCLFFIAGVFFQSKTINKNFF